MPDKELNNVNIISKTLLSTPEKLLRELPSNNSKNTVERCREQIEAILDARDKRKIIVVGPCSIHEYDLAIEYAGRLQKLSEKVSDKFLIIMRTYFEKPRTTIGWKGLINDPSLNDSFEIEKGIRLARKLLIEINSMGLPVATEALDPIMPQFISDLISWFAIGARTAESQTHREMASGLSAPVGIKNGTDGSLQIAINGMKSISESHSFLGINKEGQCCVFTTKGNAHAHIVLRGGEDTHNYDSVSIAQTEAVLKKENLPVNIMVDCSHGNSNKDHNLQPLVFENCINQILEGNQSIIGLMLESNINAGKQNLGEDPKKLKYGVSITDACIDWKTTEKVILKSYEELK